MKSIKLSKKFSGHVRKKPKSIREHIVCCRPNCSIINIRLPASCRLKGNPHSITDPFFVRYTSAKQTAFLGLTTVLIL